MRLPAPPPPPPERQALLRLAAMHEPPPRRGAFWIELAIGFLGAGLMLFAWVGFE